LNTISRIWANFHELIAEGRRLIHSKTKQGFLICTRRVGFVLAMTLVFVMYLPALKTGGICR